MSRFLEHWRNWSSSLNAEFQRERATLTDSGVKGGVNEGIVADFLRKHTPSRFVTRNCQIIDTHDQMSGEVDVCLCNDDQLFQGETRVLIAEGVDLVVQVKAVLNSEEVNRAKKNCLSVKAVKRAAAIGAVLFTSGDSKDHERIPYFVFAFTSSIDHSKIVEELTGDEGFSDQIDAVFVLDRGLTIVNCRDGNSNWRRTENDSKITGWMALNSGDMTLARFLQLALAVPRVKSVAPVSIQYFRELMHDELPVEPKAAKVSSNENGP